MLTEHLAIYSKIPFWDRKEPSMDCSLLSLIDSVADQGYSCTYDVIAPMTCQYDWH
jgi:hypothetical protein